MPGSRYPVTVALRAIAYALPAGHRLRGSPLADVLAWAWPSPEPVTLTEIATADSALHLPVRRRRTTARRPRRTSRGSRSPRSPPTRRSARPAARAARSRATSRAARSRSSTTSATSPAVRSATRPRVPEPRPRRLPHRRGRSAVGARPVRAHDRRSRAAAGARAWRRCARFRRRQRPSSSRTRSTPSRTVAWSTARSGARPSPATSSEPRSGVRRGRAPAPCRRRAPRWRTGHHRGARRGPGAGRPGPCPGSSSPCTRSG